MEMQWIASGNTRNMPGQILMEQAMYKQVFNKYGVIAIVMKLVKFAQFETYQKSLILSI